MSLYEFTNRNQVSAGLTCLGFQQLTVSNVSLALTVPANATIAIMNLDAQPIRVRLDGVAPTAAIGMLVAALDVLFISGAQVLAKFHAIRSGGVDGVLNIHYFSAGG